MGQKWALQGSFHLCLEMSVQENVKGNAHQLFYRKVLSLVLYVGF